MPLARALYSDERSRINGLLGSHTSGGATSTARKQSRLNGERAMRRERALDPYVDAVGTRLDGESLRWIVEAVALPGLGVEGATMPRT